MSTGAHGPDARVHGYRTRLDSALDRWLPAANHFPAPLHAAMRDATDGGKRLRPWLVYATADVLGLPLRAVDSAAVAVELVHAYSLVHDDLPAMDDDVLRRGKPTCHVTHGEATAILAGDALQALAFTVLARDAESGVGAGRRLAMIEALAEAAGSRGMAGGQQFDLQSSGQRLDVAELEQMHILKTGALIRASVRMACCAQDPPDDEAAAALDHFAKAVGLAFQVQDDLLDEEGVAIETGKTPGKDRRGHKATYPLLLGAGAARDRAAELFGQARDALAPFGGAATPLLELLDALQVRRG